MILLYKFVDYFPVESQTLIYWGFGWHGGFSDFSLL